jgi:hypothetical protein
MTVSVTGSATASTPPPKAASDVEDPRTAVDRYIEPAIPSLPSMRRGFTTPRSTTRGHTTALVRGAVKGWVMGRNEVACSAVSAKSLARTCTAVYGTSVGAASRRHRPAASTASDWHLRCIAVLRRIGSRVERDGGRHPLCRVANRGQAWVLTGAHARCRCVAEVAVD